MQLKAYFHQPHSSARYPFSNNCITIHDILKQEYSKMCKQLLTIRSIEEVERLIELVIKGDITFKEALKLVDSLEKEPESFDEAA